MAQETDRVIITEDKDFGTLVFAQDYKKVSVIFLRYTKEKS